MDRLGRPAGAGTRRWVQASQVGSLGELRGVLTLRGSGVEAKTVSASMAIMHLSWQGWKKVIMSYAIYLHAYFMGLPEGGDGPGAGVFVDHPRHITWTMLRSRLHPFALVSFGFDLPADGTWVTRSGELGCTAGKPSGFAVDP